MRKEIPIPKFENIDGDIFQLNEDYPVKFVLWYRDFQFKIDAGFVSDLASIPRIFRIFIDRASLGLIAPLIHDFMCSNKGKFISMSGEQINLTRYQVNLIFLIVMLLDGINSIRAIIAFIGVWIGSPRWK